MKSLGLMLLFLIAVATFGPAPGLAEGSDPGWVNRNIGYSPEEVHRYLRYRRHHRERIYRAEQRRHYHGGEYHHRAHHHQAHDDYQGYRCVSDFWGRCTRIAHHRHAYRWRYYQGAHRHSHNYRDRYAHYYRERGDGLNERIDHGRQCHARRRVIGEEKSSRAKAQRAADNAWMGSVRYDHGERFQDLNHAKDVRHNCDPSSTTTILKRVFFRCVIEATPCRAPVGSAERVERRYEEETDDDDDDRPARKR